MARKKITASFNGGDAVTAMGDLLLQIHDASDDSIIATANYAAIGSYNTQGTDAANITYTIDLTGGLGSNGQIILDGVDIGSATDIKIRCKDADGNESVLSASFSADTGWTVLGGSYDSVTVDYSATDTQPTAIFFKPDGLKMYIVNKVAGTIQEYNLSPAWDITTLSSVGTKALVGANEHSLFFKSDGLKVFWIDQTNNKLQQSTLSSAWAISSMGAATELTGLIASSLGIFFSDDGLKVFITNKTDSNIAVRTLSSAWDITTAGAATNYDASAEDTGFHGISFSDDGLKMFVVGETASTVFEYNLTTAWDITSGVTYSTNSMALGTQDTNMRGLFIKPDGTKLYSTGITANSGIYQYSMG